MLRDRTFTHSPICTIGYIEAPRDKLILAAAQRLFFERGFHAVGIDEIGERAGITGPAIYRHFSSKDEILATLFDEGSGRLIEQAASVAEQRDDPLAELQALAKAHAAYVVETKELASVLIRDDSSLAPTYRRRHQRRERPYIARWIDLVQRAFPERSEAEATTATFAALTVLNSVGTWPASARKADDLANLLAELAMGAVEQLGRTEAVS